MSRDVGSKRIPPPRRQPPPPPRKSDDYAAGIAEGRRRAAALIRTAARMHGGTPIIDAAFAAQLAEGLFDPPSANAETSSSLAEPYARTCAYTGCERPAGPLDFCCRPCAVGDVWRGGNHAADCAGGAP